MKDKELETAILSEIALLRRLIDSIGPTPLRQHLDELLTEAYNKMISFDQNAYEKGWSDYYKYED